MSGLEGASRKRACNACRQRKKKCDLGRPACVTCSKWNLPCVYDRGRSHSPPEFNSGQRPSSNNNHLADLHPSSAFDSSAALDYPDLWSMTDGLDLLPTETNYLGKCNDESYNNLMLDQFSQGQSLFMTDGILETPSAAHSARGESGVAASNPVHPTTPDPTINIPYFPAFLRRQSPPTDDSELYMQTDDSFPDLNDSGATSNPRHPSQLLPSPSEAAELMNVFFNNYHD